MRPSAVAGGGVQPRFILLRRIEELPRQQPGPGLLLTQLSWHLTWKRRTSADIRSSPAAHFPEPIHRVHDLSCPKQCQLQAQQPTTTVVLTLP
ncbi:hypothetical protein NDU88_005215 [Pleurodeles waltl]|uniref:Uncharacterized protein n=1 Tax=Pleurodeles waltl TaxID=8319 RepID=A0AAV7TBK4_PLEWA|nr:hypothetical protein NDU88_005215 [Pleurodeles waltl]